jgi:hypothetical protein
MTFMPPTPAQLIPRIPDPVRAGVRSAVWTWGRATARLRALPDFLILGAQKAGTTALYSYLRRHPAILGPWWKEVSYFDRHFARGESWYRGQFPTRAQRRLVARRTGSPTLVGEATPGYLFHPDAPERVAALLPEARLIALLRNPIDRALSHYHHEVALGREALSFEDAIDQEPARMEGELERMRDPAYFSHAWWNFTYVSRGLYAEQLERWLAVFSPQHLLVVTSDQLLEQPAESYARVLEFVGAPPHALDSHPRVFERSYPPMALATRRALAETFADSNRRVYELLGRDLGWA